jgi:hypothetical protein
MLQNFFFFNARKGSIKIECLSPAGLFCLVQCLRLRSGACPRVEMLYGRIWPNTYTLDKAGKTRQGQTL